MIWRVHLFCRYCFWTQPTSGCGFYSRNALILSKKSLQFLQFRFRSSHTLVMVFVFHNVVKWPWQIQLCMPGSILPAVLHITTYLSGFLRILSLSKMNCKYIYKLTNTQWVNIKYFGKFLNSCTIQETSVKVLQLCVAVTCQSIRDCLTAARWNFTGSPPKWINPTFKLWYEVLLDCRPRFHLGSCLPQAAAAAAAAAAEAHTHFF